MRRTALAWLLAVAALSSACGSTVQLRGSPTGNQLVASDGLSAGDPSTAGTGGRITHNAGISSSPSSSGPAVAGGSHTTGSTTARSGSVAASATSGFGFTTKQINIGVAYDSTFSQELAAAGPSSGDATAGDQKAQIEALVRDINGRGGIAGRKVVPVFYDTRGLGSNNDPSTVAQAACTKWTQDSQVFAAMTFVVQMQNETLYRCLQKKRVLFVPLGGDTTATFRRYQPLLWAPGGVAIERIPPTWIPRLAANGYFRGWDTTFGQPGSAPLKVGLLYGDGSRNNNQQADNAFVRSVTQALARQGHRVVSSFQVTNNQADASSAVLRFKNAGITHVVGDFSLVLFTQAAESQSYRPRYGYTSFSPGIAFNLFAPPQQLRGALGVGFVPSGDVENEQDPGDVSPAEAHCRRVMQQAGQPTSTRLAWFAMTWACDTFNFFEKAIRPGGLSPEGVQRTAAVMGSMPPAGTFVISFPGGRTNGASAVRDVGYDTGCRCFKYLSTRNHRI